MLEKIKELIANKDFKTLKTFLDDANNVDISECINDLNDEEMAIAFRILPKDDAADVFAYLDSDVQEKLVNLMSDSEIKDIIDELFVDDAAELISEMPANVVTRILRNTDATKRKSINEILKYPEDSAGSLMTTEYVSMNGNYTVKEAFDKIRKTGIDKETIYTIYIVDKSRKLVGVTTVKDLLLHDYNDRLEDFMEDNVITVSTETDKEEVAKMFDKYDYMVMPVVDKENRLVGIVTIDDAMEVLTEEQEEDMQIMNAVAPSDEDYFKESVFSQYKNRIVWLLFLMLSSIITGLIITKYENAFALYPVLVSFIPMIMDTGGNCGSQASTVIIRGIATGEIEPKDFLKALWKEIRIALLCGATLSVVNGIRIYVQYRDLKLAIVLGLTLVFTAMLAKSLGCLLPLAAKKLKMDPAYMASPLITTIADACSLVIYFGIAVAIMHI